MKQIITIFALFLPGSVLASGVYEFFEPFIGEYRFESSQCNENGRPVDYGGDWIGVKLTYHSSYQGESGDFIFFQPVVAPPYEPGWTKIISRRTSMTNHEGSPGEYVRFSIGNHDAGLFSSSKIRKTDEKYYFSTDFIYSGVTIPSYISDCDHTLEKI